jgi:hypothetical protein
MAEDRTRPASSATSDTTRGVLLAFAWPLLNAQKRDLKNREKTVWIFGRIAHWPVFFINFCRRNFF